MEAENINKESDAELIEIASFISEKAQIPAPSIYVTQVRIGILSVGWSPDNSAIFLGSETIHCLNKEELCNVIAHEIWHIKNRDYLLRTILFCTVGIWYCLLIGMALKPIHVVLEILDDIMNGQNPHILSDRRLFYLLGLFFVPALALFAFIVGIPMKYIFADQDYRADAWAFSVIGNCSVSKNSLSKLLDLSRKKEHSIYRYLMPIDILEFSKEDWIKRQMFGFLFPKFTKRIHHLVLLDKMGLAAEYKDKTLPSEPNSQLFWKC